jgi:cell division protein FtsB
MCQILNIIKLHHKMGRRKKQNLIGRFIFNQYLLTVLGLTIIILISLPLSRNISQRYKIDNDIKNFEQEIQDVQNKNKGLKNVLDYMDSQQFAEEQARLKFGLKKPGEEAVAIKGNSIKNDSNSLYSKPEDIFTIAGLDKKSVKPVSNPQKWIKYFFSTIN